jgi:hypothetical protein
MSSLPLPTRPMSAMYVDLVLDALDMLIEQARQTQPAAWRVLARQGGAGAADRGAVVTSVLERSIKMGRGPLLQLAFQRLEERGAIRLHQLAERERAVALESLMIALIAGTQRDLMTDADHDTLLAVFESGTPDASRTRHPSS